MSQGGEKRCGWSCIGGNLAGAAAKTLKGRSRHSRRLASRRTKAENVVARHFIALNGRLNFSRPYDTYV